MEDESALRPAWDTGWPWPLDAVQGWFEWLSNAIPWWILYDIRYLWDNLINPGLHWLRDSLEYIKDVIISHISPIASLVLDFVRPYFNWLWDTIRPWLEWLWSNLNNILAPIRDFILGLWDHITNTITSWASWLWGTIGGWLGWFQQWVGSTLANIASFISGWFTSTWQSITSWFGQVRTWLTDAQAWFGSQVIDPWTDWLRSFTDSIIHALAGLWDTLWQKLNTFWQQALSWLQAHLIDPAMAALSWLTDRLRAVVLDMFDFIFGLSDSLSPVEPIQAPHIARSVMVKLGVAAAMLAGMALAGETMHPLKNMGFGWAAAMIGDVVNFREVSGAFMRSWTDTLLYTPLLHYFRYIHRPELPERGALEAMRAKHEISADDFKYAMSFYGIPDHWISVFERYLWRDPRLFEIVRLSEVANPPEEPDPRAAAWLQERGLFPGDPRDWWYMYKFAKAGYEDVDLPVLTRVARLMSMRREQTLYLMQVRQLYRSRFIDASEARVLLRDAYLRDDVIDFRMKAMDLEVMFEARDEELRAVLDQFRRDIIEEPDFRARVQALVVDPQRAEFLINAEIAKKQREVIARERREEEKEVRKLQALYLRLYEQQFKAGHISDAEYIQQLMALGFTYEYAYALVGLATARRRAVEEARARREAAAAMARVQAGERRLALERFRSGEITEAELREALVRAGLGDEEAAVAAMAEAERVERVAEARERRERDRRLLRVQAARVAEETESLRAGVISAGEFVSRLTALGLDPGYAEAVAGALAARLQAEEERRARREEENRIARMQKAQVAMNLVRFKAGEIDEGGLKAALVEAGLTPEHAEALVEAERVKLAQLAEARAEAKARAEEIATRRMRERALVEAFRREVIDAERLAGELLELGLPEEYVSSLVEYEELRMLGR